MKIIHSKKALKHTVNINSKRELTFKDYQHLISSAKVNKTFEYFLQSITFDIEVTKINTYMIAMVSQNTELDLLLRGIEHLINNSMTLKEQNMFKLNTLYSFFHYNKSP